MKAAPFIMPEYLRTADAARYLSVSEDTVRTWLRRRILRAYKPTERALLFRRADLDAAMERFEVN